MEAGSFSTVVRLEDGAVMRLDRYLAEIEEVGQRSSIQRRLESLQCNGKRAKLSTRVRNGDHIAAVFSSSEPIGVEPQDIPLRVLYEDTTVLVLNKEQGAVVHPGAGNRNGTIANALAWRYGDAEFFATDEEDTRPGIVHRLDKDTSGVLIVAKNEHTHAFLVEQFSSRKVKKEYLAIVKGTPRPPSGTIDRPVVRDPHNRLRFTAGKDHQGKPAVTEYTTLRVFGRYALVRFSPKTGRTHQLRVHAAFLGTPILGDPIYARRDKDVPEASLMLHALSLEIVTEPGTAAKRFRAPVPSHFVETITRLRRQQRSRHKTA